MTRDQLVELSRLPAFPRGARELIRVVGADATACLIKHWGGQVWPVPMRVGGGTPAGVRRWEQLVELVGANAAAQLVRHWGGQRLQVPNLKAVIWQQTQDRIRADFDELTCQRDYSSPEAVFELGIKYGVTGKAIEGTIKRPNNERTAPDGQGQLF